MHGQVLVGERFNGGGCAVSPRAVLTARHVIRDRKDARLGFRLPTGRTVEVIRTEDDEQLDIAVLHLAEDVDATYVTTAVAGDEWRVLRPPPAGNDPELSGTVTSAARRIKNAQGHEVEIVQLLVDEDMREFSGYSGSAVVLPPPAGSRRSWSNKCIGVPRRRAGSLPRRTSSTPYPCARPWHASA